MKKSKGTVLIIDDNPINLKVAALVLKGAGYDFRLAKSGPAALSVLDKSKPDLILLDIQMPEMDGFETCEKIREDKTNSEIPIIFLSANNDAEIIHKAFKFGAADFVTKPFNSDELLARTKTHIKLKKLAEELLKIRHDMIFTPSLQMI